MWRADSLENILMLGNIEGRRRSGWQRMRWLAGPTQWTWDGWTCPTQWTWVWARSGRWWRTGKPGVLQSTGLQTDMTEWLNKNLWELGTILKFLCINSLNPYTTFKVWFCCALHFVSVETEAQRNGKTDLTQLTPSEAGQRCCQHPCSGHTWGLSVSCPLSKPCGFSFGFHPAPHTSHLLGWPIGN